MITPLEDRVLVRFKKTEEKTAGGIILTSDTRKNQEREQRKVEVMKLGETAFIHYKISPEVGDMVYIERHAGISQREKIDGYIYQTVLDRDIFAMDKDIDVQKRLQELDNE